MKSTITATVRQIKPLSISLCDVYANGKWLPFHHTVKAGNWASGIREGETIQFDAELQSSTHREFDGDVWENVTHYRIKNPTHAEVIKPA